MGVYRCYSEKKAGFDIEAKSTLRELRDYLGVRRLESLRILYRYDIEGISGEMYDAARETVFSEPQTDMLFDEAIPGSFDNAKMLIKEPLPGQYNQRAHACCQCLELLAINLEQTAGGMAAEAVPPAVCSPIVRTANVYLFYGEISADDLGKLRGYIINPLEACEATQEKPSTLVVSYPEPEPVATVKGLITADENELSGLIDSYSLALDMADLRFVQTYFRDTEKRDPTATELRMIDTYWSDHCRHTTFLTHITDVAIDDPEVKKAYDSYIELRREAYGPEADSRPQTLMDIATVVMKAMKRRGMLGNMEVSEEVNACSIHIDCNAGDETEDWLLMFKNETHNHPTEVEPFGGASTCVGGAIRDPLSGRAFVYQSIRLTGAGDPRAPITDTIPGKHPQRKLTLTAAQGFSSYANQIGLAAGLVDEIYHPGYVAKRMELGAVVGAVKAGNVVRETPAPGDKVLLIGARTGRDGIGGATGSSRSQTTESHMTMAAEVQKGDAPEERKIQRLFLDPEVTLMIKKSNDFGAGGVSVAVGELADGLDIDLSLVRCKYGGLDGTEIALSESQERMAVVVAPGNVDRIISKAEAENLEAYVIAEVTKTPRIVMRMDGEIIVDISREFLSTNGTAKRATVHVQQLHDPSGKSQLSTFDFQQSNDASPVTRLKALVTDLRCSSRRGLQEYFDGNAGASSVLTMRGGKTQSTPVQATAMLLPVQDAKTTTCSVMAYGFDPYLSSINPFIGAKTAVITSVAKLVAAGCDPDVVYLSFQEFFERLGESPTSWGKPFSALLGAFEAQMGLQIASIGGKDSMSGSYNDINVPPTLVSFAIAPNDASFVISPEFKGAGHEIVLFDACDDLTETKAVWKKIRTLIETGTIVSAWAVTEAGILEGIFKMSLGNEIGFKSYADIDADVLFSFNPGAIIAESVMPVQGATPIGRTIPQPVIDIGGSLIEIAELKQAWEGVLETVFPTRPKTVDQPGPRSGGEPLAHVPAVSFDSRPAYVANERFAKPRALIFTFPGTHCEIDTARAISLAGGAPKTIVIRNKTSSMLEESIAEAVREIKLSQILILPGGASTGGEPDGSAKYINMFFRNRAITAAVQEHLKTGDGLILGICNGFQALIKLGLVPFGEILPQAADFPIDVFSHADRPTLAGNLIGRHQSKYVHTRITSVNSPWMNGSNVGDIHTVPITFSEGRVVIPDSMLNALINDGRIATQYVDADGLPSMDIEINPGGSALAIEGLFSPDGRVFGKMGHFERCGEFVAKNIYGVKHQPIFESGVNYYK